MTKAISVEEFRKLNTKPPKKSKYGNTKFSDNGMKFDSKKEYNHYNTLKTLFKAGLINDLRCQVVYLIIVSGCVICKYIADFTYIDENGTFVVEDVKSEATKSNAVYRLKKKLMKAVHNIEIKEV